MSKIEQCTLDHLKDVTFSKDLLDQQIKEITAKRFDIKVKGPDGKMALDTEVLVDLKQQVKNAIEESIDGEIKKIDAGIKASDMIARVMDKQPRNTSEALAAIGNEIYGKNGLDTVRKSYKTQLELEYLSLNSRFGVSQDLLDKIRKDKSVEREVFKTTQELNMQIDPRQLTNSKIKELTEGATEIQRAAMALRAYNEHTRLFLNSKGIAVKYHSKYVVKRQYKFAFMEAMGEDNFIDFMIDRLDDETFSPKIVDPNGSIIQKAVSRDRKEAYLREFYTELRNTEGHLGTFFEDGRATRTKAESYQRQFIFKDADAEYDVFDQLSGGNLLSQIEQGAFGAASTAAKVQKLSYNHEAVMQEVKNYIKKELPPAKGKLTKALDRMYYDAKLTQAIADFTGENRYTPTAISTIGNVARFFSSFKMLGNAIATAMLDPVDTMRVAYTTNGQLFGGFVQYQKNFLSLINQHGLTLKKNRAELLEMGRMLGVVLNHASTDSSMRMARGDIAISRNSIDGFIDKYGAKLMNVATLLPHQTIMSRFASAATGAQIFNDMMSKASIGKKFNKFEKNTLDLYEFNAADITALNKYVGRVETWGGQIYDPKGIRDDIMFASNRDQIAKDLGIPDEELNDYAVKLAEKYSRYLEDFGVRGTPQPQLSQKVALMKGSNSEAWNVISGLITQFKDTPLMQLQSYGEMVDTIKKVNNVRTPERYGIDAETAQYAKELVTKVAPELATQVVPHMIGASAMFLAYDSIMALIQGKESRYEKFMKTDDFWEQKQIALDVMGRTSAIPFMFEMLNSATSIYGGGVSSEFFPGPVFSQLGEIEDLINPNTASMRRLKKFGMRQIPNSVIINVPANIINKALGNKGDWRKIE